MTTKTRIVAALALLSLLAGAAACSGGSGSSDGASRHADDLTVCFYDGGPCADVPDPGSAFEAGAPSVPGFPEAGAPAPGSPSFGLCGFDAKYPTEYWSAVGAASVKPCWMGCASTECCYAGLACVAQ